MKCLIHRYVTPFHAGIIEISRIVPWWKWCKTAVRGAYEYSPVSFGRVGESESHHAGKLSFYISNRNP